MALHKKGQLVVVKAAVADSLPDHLADDDEEEEENDDGEGWRLSFGCSSPCVCGIALGSGKITFLIARVLFLSLFLS